MFKPNPQTAMSDHDILHAATHVLTAEGDALKQLADALDGAFVRAVEMVMQCRGRVIVTGMGKSGHIARKIAATLASTGTPAAFVHPGEASHGDLGMIMESDIVMALSNSGEVSELSDLIHYTRRFAIPLLAVTRKADSALGSAADITLTLPLVPEVCPMGLAPTTSTTMMLGLGDALAIAVMESKGFTVEAYRNFHPGGKLGKMLLRVGDLMRTGGDMPLVSEQTAMSDVLVVMTEKALGCAGVTDVDGKLVGIITDGDLRRHMQDNLLTQSAGQVMTRSPLTITPQTLAAEALKIINDKQRTQLFATEGGNPVGVIHIHDLLRAGIA